MNVVNWSIRLRVHVFVNNFSLITPTVFSNTIYGFHVLPNMVFVNMWHIIVIWKIIIMVIKFRNQKLLSTLRGQSNIYERKDVNGSHTILRQALTHTLNSYSNQYPNPHPNLQFCRNIVGNVHVDMMKITCRFSRDTVTFLRLDTVPTLRGGPTWLSFCW